MFDPVDYTEPEDVPEDYSWLWRKTDKEED